MSKVTPLGIKTSEAQVSNGIGGKLRDFRVSLNMTQEQFARELDVTVSTVNRWENGKSKPSRLAKKLLDHFSKERGVEPPDLP